MDPNWYRYTVEENIKQTRQAGLILVVIPIGYNVIRLSNYWKNCIASGCKVTKLVKMLVLYTIIRQHKTRHNIEQENGMMQQIY